MFEQFLILKDFVGDSIFLRNPYPFLFVLIFFSKIILTFEFLIEDYEKLSF